MDLELSDEQAWLGESVETLLARDPDDVWARLVEFGALSAGATDGVGAVGVCLIARSLGEHLASVPFLGSAAVRYAADVDLGDRAVGLALLEPGAGWGSPPATTADGAVTGRKVAVEHAASVERLAVVAAGPVVVLVDHRDATVTPQPSFDETAPMFAVDLDDTPITAVLPGEAVGRLHTIGALLAAAEAVGAAARLLDDAARYAAERRQFGRTIGSFQAIRHLLADMYVRQASCWSSVLYAAASLDEGAPDAAQTAGVAKAYVSRAAREVAHGALQVFGGIAVTAEHPAHRYLRRIVVREQQFGNALHHERALGRALAATAPLAAAG